jgi:hypothetical protein
MDIILKLAEGGIEDGSTEGRPCTRMIISKVTVK